ncbi:MAG: SE1832 family protein [Staphylococcus epidermidis]|nr:SE1832 family protein [Staphylococcus epidermidis]
MDLNSKLSELKYDYTRLQNDLEKRESLHQDIDPLLKQLENIEQEISYIRSKLNQQSFKLQNLLKFFANCR